MGKRSGSLLGRITKAEGCKWLYQFNLVTVERTYELYSPTSKDREQWVRLFSLLIEMYKNKITTQQMDPLQYESEHQLTTVAQSADSLQMQPYSSSTMMVTKEWAQSDAFSFENHQYAEVKLYFIFGQKSFVIVRSDQPDNQRKVKFRDLTSIQPLEFKSKQIKVNDTEFIVKMGLKLTADSVITLSFQVEYECIMWQNML